MIKDTCTCGAELVIDVDFGSITQREIAVRRHDSWLKAHQGCRESLYYVTPLDETEGR